MQQGFETPILFLIFNRPDTTQRVLDVIKQAKPKYLYVAADGPRPGNGSDKEKCAQARKIIAQHIDWPCKLTTLYRDHNLGCKKAVSTAISWFFGQVTEGIILEDDTLPHPSFFSYCSTMLGRYRNNEQVMHVAGVNFQNGIKRGRGNYYFSKYPHVWGWATWKRAWSSYDPTIARWPAFKLSRQFKQWCFNRREQQYWTHVFDEVYNGSIDTWDYQWVLAIMQKKGCCLMPDRNLVANIGFRADATHTREYNRKFAGNNVFEYALPDAASPVFTDKAADLYSFRHVFEYAENAEDQYPSLQKKIRLVVSGIRRRLKKVFA